MNARLRGMIEDRKDQTYDGECHLSNEEANEIIAALAVIRWQPMSEAPTDGTHCIFAVRSEPFIFATQGAYLSGEWCAAFIDGPVEPLAWMPNVRLPEWAIPWKQEEVR